MRTPFYERGHYGMRGKVTMTTATTERAYRLAVIGRHGHVPHAFTAALQKKWGIVVCVVCGKGRLYFGHDDDLRAE